MRPTLLAFAAVFAWGLGSASARCLKAGCPLGEFGIEASLARTVRCRGGGSCRGSDGLSPHVQRQWGKLLSRREGAGPRWWGGVNSAGKAVVARGGAKDAQDDEEIATYRKALLRTCLVFASAVAFGLGTMVVKGKQSGMEFFTGYLVEQSLSVDNLFVFIMLFEYFKVPQEFQSRVLTWGIIGAISMRAVMIVVGVAVLERFRWVTLLFAGILVVSSAKLLMDHDDEEGEMENNGMVKVSKWLVNSTDKYDGEKFFTIVDGVKRATPLLLCLVCIELSDFVFAVDSIPAVLGISKDSFIVYTSNVFAILALRSLYTLVSHAITDLPYLKPAVALVLGFVGGKMAAEFFHYEVSTGLSLSVVFIILAGGSIASVWDNRRKAMRQATTITGGELPESSPDATFTTSMPMGAMGNDIESPYSGAAVAAAATQAEAAIQEMVSESPEAVMAAAEVEATNEAEATAPAATAEAGAVAEAAVQNTADATTG